MQLIRPPALSREPSLTDSNATATDEHHTPSREAIHHSALQSALLHRISQVSPPPGSPLSLIYDSWSETGGFQTGTSSNAGDLDIDRNDGDRRRQVYRPASIEELVLPSIVFGDDQNDALGRAQEVSLANRPLQVVTLGAYMTGVLGQRHGASEGPTAVANTSLSSDVRIRSLEIAPTDLLHDIQGAFEQLDQVLARDFSPESVNFWKTFDLLWYATLQIDLVLMPIKNGNFDQDMHTLDRLSHYIPTLPFVEEARDAELVCEAIYAKHIPTMSTSTVSTSDQLDRILHSDSLRHDAIERVYECFSNWRALQSLPGSLSSSVVFDAAIQDSDASSSQSQCHADEGWSAQDPLPRSTSLFSLGFGMLHSLVREKHLVGLASLAIASASAAALGWFTIAGVGALATLDIFVPPDLTGWAETSMLYL